MQERASAQRQQLEPRDFRIWQILLQKSLAGVGER
jgi:hypothetical protein